MKPPYPQTPAENTAAQPRRAAAAKFPIYVIGHKNPDVDSVCAAVGYAALKNALGCKEYVPARCGNSNARIDAVLRRFGIPLPRFVGDVTPRLRDVMTSTPHTISPNTTCGEALELIDRHDIRALPVVDQKGGLRGLVSIFNLSEFFVPKPRESTRHMRRVHTSVAAVARSLKARPWHLEDAEREEDIYVRVGAMDLESFRRFSAREGIEPRQSGVIVGDRADIQNASIEMGVRLLVLTGGLPVNPEVVRRAREKGVCLITSPYDTASTAWIIRSAAFVEPLMDASPERWSADEKLSSLRRRIAYTPEGALHCVADAEGRLVGVFTRGDLLRPIDRTLVLVDHNELSQAVSGADEVHIESILDHHRLGNLPTLQPILFRNEPVGATCTIVADLFRQYGVRPAPAVAGVLMSGIIADTLNLKSPTATEKDREILAWLEPIAGVFSDELAGLIADSGSLISKIPHDELVVADCKRYDEGKCKFSVSQVEELGFEQFNRHTGGIADALEAYRRREGFAFSALLVTDINTQNSRLLIAGNEDIARAISYPKVGARADIFELAGVVSRKKQLIPYLIHLVNTLALT